MKKNVITTGVICGILLTLFSIIFFAVIENITSEFLAGYIYLVLSIAAQLVPSIMYRNNTDVKFMYFSEIIVFSIYFIIQLVLSLIILLSENIMMKTVIVSESILIGVFVIFFYVPGIIAFYWFRPMYFIAKDYPEKSVFQLLSTSINNDERQQTDMV